MFLLSNWMSCPRLMHLKNFTSCFRQQSIFHSKRLCSTMSKVTKIHPVFRHTPAKLHIPKNSYLNFTRMVHEKPKEQVTKNRNVFYYCTAFVLLVGGFTYSSVFLYRMYCQSTGKGGRAFVQDVGEIVEKMQPNKNRLITVNFNADRNSRMAWNFKPQQSHIKVSPGETALAFYSAENPTDRPVSGIATYNVLPYDAGKYFNKIQCFCFEEQQLNPHEEVDLPVFFYLDPEYAEDPRLENIDDIILSYTFFEAKEGLELPMPSFS